LKMIMAEGGKTTSRSPNERVTRGRKKSCCQRYKEGDAVETRAGIEARCWRNAGAKTGISNERLRNRQQPMRGAGGEARTWEASWAFPSANFTAPFGRVLKLTA
jgi:hypothetical protein